jgi:hypothetical protein
MGIIIIQLIYHLYSCSNNNNHLIYRPCICIFEIACVQSKVKSKRNIAVRSKRVTNYN